MNKPKAYSGNLQYIFISYSHIDTNSVYPIILWLQDNGYRVWYDEGIEFGNEWPDELAKAIENCSQFIVFLSKSSIGSYYVNKEINFALNLKKKILPVFIENVELPSKLSFKLSDIQAILKYGIDDEQFFRFLKKGLMEETHGDAVQNYIPNHKKYGSIMVKKNRIGAVLACILIVFTAVSIIKIVNSDKNDAIITYDIQTIEAPTITNPSNGLVIEAGKSIQISWKSGTNAEYYLLNLMDNTSNKSLLNDIQIYGTSYMLDSKYFSIGHKYSISLKSISKRMEKPNPDWPSSTVEISTKMDKLVEQNGLIRSEVIMDNDYWIQDDTLNYKYIECELNGDGEDEVIKIGNDTPMGSGEKVVVFVDNIGVNLLYHKSSNETIPTDSLYEEGSLAKGNKIQVGCYDFDNDNNKEIIVAIGDEMLSLDVSVFKYVGGQNLYQEIGHIEGQEYLLVTKEGFIDVPIGSQGLFNRYMLKDGSFVEVIQ